MGHEFPPLVIAEIGINHGGQLPVALEMVEAAARAGCEVVKHQTHVVDDEMTPAARTAIPGNTTESIYGIMERCALSEEDERALKEAVEAQGMTFISTPFSRAAADRLAAMDVAAFKIGSGECNNLPLVEHVARFGKPVLISTGMNDLDSVARTVEVVRRHGVPFALLHCTNVYPTPPRLVRLGAISSLQAAFPDAIVGLSDHTTSIYTCLGAVALGASVLERHFTDSRNRPGPDIPCSMTPTELSQLIEGATAIHEARGGEKGMVDEERVCAEFAFATVMALRDIAEGEVLREDSIWVRRPGTGEIPAADYQAVVGRVAARRIARDQHLCWADLLPLP